MEKNKMDTFYIYCKSYKPDLHRVKNLAGSIIKHNVDSIPFYVSCPAEDYQEFKRVLPGEVNLITDEEIVERSYIQTWKTQQIVKSQFWKYANISNYMCIDSDCYFIKDFCLRDFMATVDTPYTVMHQQKNLFQWSCRYDSLLGFDPMEGFNSTRSKIGNLFDRKIKVNYDFGPVPVIWSSKVWKSLEENYLNPNNLEFNSLIEFEPSEFTWYGEWLLASRVIDIYPIEPLFLVFHYAEQLKQFNQLGYTEEQLAKCYLGLVMTSNWGSPLKYSNN